MTPLKVGWFLVTIAFFSMGHCTANSGVVVCYYPSYVYTILPPNNIDISICTHISYAFVGINADGTLTLSGKDGPLYELSALKKKNKDLKVLISIGGWSDAKNFSKVAADDDATNNLVESALQFINKYNLDGIDIDWEYPGHNGGTPNDKENFVDLCRKLKSSLKINGYLLTAALWSNPADDSFDVPALSQELDLMHVMLYDFHMGTEKKTGQNAPLYESPSDTPYERLYGNCNVSISKWLAKGAEPSKVTFGLAFYGRSYTLADPDKFYVGAPAIGKGELGSALTYGKICKLDWEEEWDEAQQVPYKHKGNQWVGYDNPRSIEIKVKYAKSHNLAGVMVWTMAQDDLSGSCGSKNLLQSIKEAW